MGYRAILFDLDGTLLDTTELIIASFQHTFQQFLGHEVSRAEILHNFGEPLEATFIRCAAGDDRVTREMIAYYREHNLREHDRLAQPYPGARMCLEGLRNAGLVVGVVTSKLRATAMRGLALDNWEPLLDVVICYDDCKEHKPKPAPILAALDKLGLPAGRDVLMVGDTTMDILAGQAAGVSTAGVRWSTQPDRLRAVGPDLLVPDFATLLAACL